ncbi:uncharacterized protein EI97DRAFT_454178 [Westerdykella ornata]|uniref:Uncharacterized protein n=1 Tax=Westerdykella ornata TaxID=318751 RepID=A0A6A6JWG4_WESOR|nr:uncharacterized protein EI97DRAFT_454178 [Westerdykella ornata]KAF2280951.1 hypothetical protein EI97DRAFT_454178 [Westerdykella ornata]
MEEAEDVYRFQELDSDDERYGVLVDPGYQGVSSSKNINPDELYFNDMDLRAWERNTGVGVIDEMGYGDEYAFEEDGEYYDEATGLTMSLAEYEEHVFQGVLDKIRRARVAGESDVNLSTEELEIYRSRLLGHKVPAARPQPTTLRPVSASAVPTASAIAVNSTTDARNLVAGSVKSSKNRSRTSSFFGLRPKKDKTNGRRRAPSITSQPPHQDPAFVVPGPNGHSVYAPINGHHDRMFPQSPPPPSASSQPGSRLMSSGHQSQVPAHIAYAREVPGAFPSSPPRSSASSEASFSQQYRRPTSSSSRQLSGSEQVHATVSPDTRSRSSSIQQTVKLVPIPVPDYQHHNTEPYQYHVPGQTSPTVISQTPSSPTQLVRRVVSGPSDSYVAMPRRVPIPVQGPNLTVPGSSPDLMVDLKDGAAEDHTSDEEGEGGIVGDVGPQAAAKAYKVQTVKPSGSGTANGKESDRRKRTHRKKKS